MVPKLRAGSDVTVTLTVPVTGDGVPVPVPVPLPVDAVTVASRFVERVTRASPSADVVAIALDKLPASVPNTTGIPARTFPLPSVTVALIVQDRLPLLSRVALTTIREAAAAPTRIRTPGFCVSAGLAPPDTARTSASPDCPFATSRVVAMPLTVDADRGSRVPRVVENVTDVPLWTGVPDCSSTVAMISVDPVAEMLVLPAESVMVDSPGASNGTFSHPVITMRDTSGADSAQIGAFGREALFRGSRDPAKMNLIRKRVGSRRRDAPGEKRLTRITEWT
jgi:hypothetical protein